MAFQNRKKELFDRYNNMRLMNNYRENQEKQKHPVLNTGKALYNTYKNVQRLNNTRQMLAKPYQPSTIGNGINSNIANSNLGSNISNIGNSPVSSAIDSNIAGSLANNTSNISNATQGASNIANTAQGASTAGGASQALGTTGSALSVGLDAKNMMNNGINFNNGTDMAADAASLALMSSGAGAPVAAAIQAAKTIKNMVTGAIQNKKQKAMAKSAQKAAEEAQFAESEVDAGRQGMAEQKQENQQKMQQFQQQKELDQQQQQQPTQDNEALVQEILNGVQNPQQAGYSGQLPQLNQVPQGQPTTPNITQEEQPEYLEEQPQLEQIPQEETKQDILSQLQNLGIGQGQATGGAAPVSMPTNYAEENMPVLTPEEESEMLQNQQQLQQPLLQQSQQVQPENLTQSLIDKFKNGLNDFSAGYQDNVSTDFAHGDLMNGIATGGAAPVQQGNTFNLGTVQNKKGVMARLGELVGTGQRVASHPLTQAGIAALVSKAAGGDVDDMAKAALQYGTQKAQADRYYQQITGNTDRPFFNNYSAQDVTNKRLEDQIAQKQQQWMYEQMIKQAQQDYNNQFNREKFEYQKNKDKEANALKREEIATRREYYKNRGGGKQQVFDPTAVPGFYDDYDKLEQMKNLEEGSDEYNNELNDVLDAMYQGQKDGWWGKYSDEQINAAKQRMKEVQRQYERDFNKKYRINPLKGKKS